MFLFIRYDKKPKDNPTIKCGNYEKIIKDSKWSIVRDDKKKKKTKKLKTSRGRYRPYTKGMIKLGKNGGFSINTNGKKKLKRKRINEKFIMEVK